MTFLYQDQDIVIIDKEAGFFVHPPQEEYYLKNPVPRSQICLFQVRDLIKQKVYPVHRLDVATSGVLVFAKSSEMASHLCKQFAERTVTKKYLAIVRGYTSLEDTINIPLESHSQASTVEALTNFTRLACLELPHQVGKKYATARYSLLEVRPQSGRYHQIRRHFNRISHPVIGDGTHGDSRHNTFFREHLKMPGLFLRAYKLSFNHPRTFERFNFEVEDNSKWQKVKQLDWIFDSSNSPSNSKNHT